MSFDYGGVDFGATLLKDRAAREMKKGGLSDETLVALEANRVMPPEHVATPKAKKPKSSSLSMKADC